MSAMTTPTASPFEPRNDTERAMLAMLRKLPDEGRRAFHAALLAMADGTDLRPHVIAVYRATGSADPEAAAAELLAGWDTRGEVRE